MVCDLCKKECKVYIDGKTKSGPWAYMCVACHKVHGVGLGLGKGQKYPKSTKKAKKVKMKFDAWMDAVDNLVMSVYDLSIYDLPDMSFRDSYDNGVSPEQFFETDVESVIDSMENEFAMLEKL